MDAPPMTDHLRVYDERLAALANAAGKIRKELRELDDEIWRHLLSPGSESEGALPSLYSEVDRLISSVRSPAWVGISKEEVDARNSRVWWRQSPRLDGEESAFSLLQVDEPPDSLVEVVQTITAELIEHLRKNPRELYQLRPRQFEELIAGILSSFGWKVQLTPATRDGGYDIYGIVTDEISGVKNHWLIECKKYSKENMVGVDIVRALYGLGLDLGVGNTMLATTSYFSRDALAYKESRYNLELRDFRGILKWINAYYPNPQGQILLKDHRIVLPGKEAGKC